MRGREDLREREDGLAQQEVRGSRDLLETRDCQVSQDPWEREEGRECEVPWDRRERRAEQLCRAKSDHGGCRDLSGLKAGLGGRGPRAVLEVREWRD